MFKGVMNLPRRFFWDPFEEMRRMQRFFDRMFSGLVEEGPFESSVTSVRQPLADVWETKDAFYASVELPGINKEDIEINVVDNGLEIKAMRKEETKEHKKGFYKIERNYSGFYKFIALPENALPEKAEAKYKNGILEIKIPKSKAKEPSKKRIEIK
jgi:HSP20 family protein